MHVVPRFARPSFDVARVSRSRPSIAPRAAAGQQPVRRGRQRPVGVRRVLGGGRARLGPVLWGRPGNVVTPHRRRPINLLLLSVIARRGDGGVVDAGRARRVALHRRHRPGNAGTRSAHHLISRWFRVARGGEVRRVARSVVWHCRATAAARRRVATIERRRCRRRATDTRATRVSRGAARWSSSLDVIPYGPRPRRARRVSCARCCCCLRRVAPSPRKGGGGWVGLVGARPSWWSGGRCVCASDGLGDPPPSRGLLGPPAVSCARRTAGRSLRTARCGIISFSLILLSDHRPQDERVGDRALERGVRPHARDHRRLHRPLLGRRGTIVVFSATSCHPQRNRRERDVAADAAGRRRRSSPRRTVCTTEKRGVCSRSPRVRRARRRSKHHHARLAV